MGSMAAARCSSRAILDKITGVRRRLSKVICSSSSSNGVAATAPTMGSRCSREEGSTTMALVDSSRPMRRVLPPSQIREDKPGGGVVSHEVLDEGLNVDEEEAMPGEA